MSQNHEQRILKLENTAKLIADLEASAQRMDYRNKGDFFALYSLVSEIAEHCGVSLEHFATCHKERSLYFLDYLHRIDEDRDPNRAALFDDRNLSEIPLDASFPPLFPETK